MVKGCAEFAQVRLLFLHVRNVCQIALADLGARLLLVIGQNVSGLMHKCIGILERGPQRRSARECPGENLLQVL
jgi:hypothetical protein